jgi:purine-nucleoside phosphorylase
MTILSAGDNESFDFAKPIGIGLINSSINLTKFILENQPKSLLFIGTAGSYGNLKPFDLVTSLEATNIETGFFLDNCYTPISNNVKSIMDNVSCETANKNTILVNSSNYITTNKILSNKYLKYGLEAENMEFYSILTVAKEFNIEAYGIFIITNYCDEYAHTNFLKNHSKAMEKLTRFVRKQVSNI